MQLQKASQKEMIFSWQKTSIIANYFHFPPEHFSASPQSALPAQLRDIQKSLLEEDEDRLG